MLPFLNKIMGWSKNTNISSTEFIDNKLINNSDTVIGRWRKMSDHGVSSSKSYFDTITFVFITDFVLKFISSKFLHYTDFICFHFKFHFKLIYFHFTRFMFTFHFITAGFLFSHQATLLYSYSRLLYFG